MQNNFYSNWNYPTTIHFGIGRSQELPSTCKSLNIKHPLIITDPSLAKLPLFAEILSIFQQHHMSCDVFCDIKANPIAENISAGVSHYKENKHDGVVAIGGGSALDSAKTIALMVGQTRPLWDFEDIGDNFKRVNTHAMAPLIAVPTTSGTGSEVGRAALIIDTQKQQKRFIFHPNMMPNLVVADPALTTGLPAKLTAATGMDAFTHNFEAFCAKGYHPLADGIALEGMRLIANWLPVAVDDGNNLEARANLMAASIMGGTAFQKGLGAIHSLSHPVGAIYDAHHGLLNAIFLPYVLAHNHKALQERLIQLARYMDLDVHTYPAVLSWITKLLDQINIPKTLADIHVNEQHIDTIVEQALQDPSTAGNPLDLTIDDFRVILTNALHGRLT